ncbi:uncharacterized protein LOC114427114 isoform X3 [Parambassis ranga]|uniref:Uncharacterized protein LOC114427114 isoform X3 n=1 Tax=Parambassis ranga TaxID=210632 RepID=A0A6P7HQ26_9TELE|nr:uncharacterized protein LOC114427114 isoform X3 [Parambassis ranga]
MDFLHSTQGIRQWKNMEVNSTFCGHNVRLRELLKQKWEERMQKSPELLLSDEVRLEPRRAPSPPCRSSVRPVYSKRRPELSSGSSDSLDQSSKRSCSDFVPDMSLCEERERINHLFKLLLSGQHGIRDRLMSSNQDQPQSEVSPTSPGSFDSCGESVRSDESKGQGINFQRIRYSEGCDVPAAGVWW